MRKTLLFSSLIGLSTAAYAFPEIKFVRPKGYEVQEIVGAYSSGKSYSPSIEPTVVIPYQRTFAQFGGLGQNNDRTICGPSPNTNSMNCFDLKHNGVYAGSFPVPGMLSSTPVFYENSWLIGTAKGFLMRVNSMPSNRNLPALGLENINFWGGNSRAFMASFRPKPIYTDNQQASSSEKAASPMPAEVKWILPTSSPFVGTPLIKNGIAYLFSANQYFQAIDWNTGKDLWSIRLAPDTTLKLNSTAMAATDSELIVGNSLGTVLILNPNDGSVLWTIQIPQADSNQRSQTKLPAGPDKFSSIVAAPLVFGRNMVVSNAESMTQNISLDSKSVLWSYPMGSVAQAQLYQDQSVILGSENGHVISLDANTGSVNWDSELTNLSPITSLFITKSNAILAATNRGKIFMLDPKDGHVLSHNYSIGEVNGEFFAGYQGESACLSFAMEGFRCFKAKL
jgi:hypothetical protein